MQTPLRTWDSIRELIRSWYRVDRIRVACSEGSLCCIPEGSQVLIGECLFDVVSRSEHFWKLSHAVSYRLCSDNGSAHLTVSLATEHGRWRTSMELTREGDVACLCDGDVTVLNAMMWFLRGLSI